jgi:two-component system, NtrC family, sensor histidine kinase KinB
MNKLSNKTSAILRENYLSVVYAREMSDGIMNINKEITTSFLMHRISDSLIVAKEIGSISQSLAEEKNNITEPGEEMLVNAIESGFNEYRNAVLNYAKSPVSEVGMLFLVKKSGDLYHQLLLLSQMNGKALEVKTDDAKASSKSALTQMTILATLCFLIGMSFTFSFATYFNRRFFQLYYGIKEIASSNFDERLVFEGKDEFYEISMVINEMAEKIKKNKPNLSVTLQEDHTKEISSNDLEELKNTLYRIKSMEGQVNALISKFEKK